MWTRVSTLVVWALAAGSIVFWGLRLFAAANPPPAGVQLAAAGQAPRGDLSRLLGTDAVPEAPPEAPVAAPDPRFQLVGVVSPRSPRAAREALAVIVVDDKPARAYRVGAVVDGQTVLQSVNPRGASLGPKDGAAVVALDLPPPAAAATGQLPPPLPGPGAGSGNGGVNPSGARYRAPTQAPPPPQQTQSRSPTVPQMGPQPGVQLNALQPAQVIPVAPGQPQGFDRSGAPLR